MASGAERLIARLATRLRLLVARAVVRAVNDAGGLQRMTVDALPGEALRDVPRFQGYGITSHPLQGSEAVLVAVGGARAHLAAVAVDDRRYRPRDLEPGELVLYTDEGVAIELRRNRVVRVTGASIEVEADGGALTLRGESVHVEATAGNLALEASGTVDVDGASVDIDATGAVDVDGADVAIAGSATAELDAPATTIPGALVDIQSKGDYKLHTHFVGSTPNDTGPVN